MRRRTGRPESTGTQVYFAPDGADFEQDAGEVFTDAVEWLDGADEDEVGHRAAALPTRATRHRVLGSLLAAGVALAAAGFGANSVYHRDLTADYAAHVAANELILTGPPSPEVSLPELDAVGASGQWIEQPRTEVAVTLVNRGSEPVTLLPGATLLGAGVTASSFGGGDRGQGGTTVLAPGRSVVLRGFVTVDCVFSDPDVGVRAQTHVTVRARTSGGGLGVSTVTYGAAEGSVRDRVCSAQDSAITHGIAASGRTSAEG